MLMRLSGYPGYEAHRRLHEYLTDRAATFQARFRADPATFSVDKLYEFLANWLHVHIMREDMKIKPYVDSLAQAQAAFSPEIKTPPCFTATPSLDCTLRRDRGWERYEPDAGAQAGSTTPEVLAVQSHRAHRESGSPVLAAPSASGRAFVHFGGRSR
jgi:hypothetical protein